MYGMVNKFFQQIITEKVGLEIWQLIAEKTKFHSSVFVNLKQYPDAITYDMVTIACEQLNCSLEDFLIEAGKQWIPYTLEGEYRALYEMSGDNIVDFLRNLDNLHINVGNLMTELDPPSFKCTEITKNSLRLHYYSNRPGLAPFVMGILTGLGIYFKTPVKVHHDTTNTNQSDHDEFILRF